jgi:catechol 2,3-dioxygenase-like lactoylglutathione lyase family enzyme
VRVVGLDHLVLLVADVERSLAFYCGQLGLQPVRLEEWRRGEVPFVSVRVDEGCIIDLLEGEATGTNVDHLCLVVDELDPDALVAGGVEVLTEPVRRFGARGDATSIYVGDPDGHVVELRAYPPA